MSDGLTIKQMSRLELYLANESVLNQRLLDAGQSERLRFNRIYVKASTIAEQFYCEVKVEMGYLHGRVETETKREGSEGHETLQSGSLEAERGEILRKIFSGEPIIVHELPFLAGYRDVILAGQPDAILFKGGDPLIVFEYKFSNSPYPYKSYHAQARV
ncbi:MAG: hypothetical protein NTY03_10225, partial [Candidatus Bathyarchaeota archaeon]|nr:hypothetical protein [Candidatus Bathyarchaeota archaeon]